MYAFEGCSGLTSITIPDSVTEIKPEAFKGCSGLKTIFYTKFAVPENPGSANLIKYKVDSDDNGIKNVTLTTMSSTEHTSLSCNAMGAGYRIVGVDGSIADKLTLNHNYDDKVEAKEPTAYKSDNFCGKQVVIDHSCDVQKVTDSEN